MRCVVEHNEKMTVSASSRSHNILMDIAKPVGNDKGMTPGEAFLNAIAGCKVISFISLAKMNNIKVENLVIDMEGGVAQDGFVEGTEIPKKIISSIHTIYKMKTENTKEEIETHIKLVDELCTVGNSISEKIKKTHEIIIEN